eukprot:scaffold15696_cov113-Isochrysis_galbana.AAC.4
MRSEALIDASFCFRWLTVIAPSDRKRDRPSWLFLFGVLSNSASRAAISCWAADAAASSAPSCARCDCRPVRCRALIRAARSAARADAGSIRAGARAARVRQRDLFLGGAEVASCKVVQRWIGGSGGSRAGQGGDQQTWWWGAVSGDGFVALCDSLASGPVTAVFFFFFQQRRSHRSHVVTPGDDASVANLPLAPVPSRMSLVVKCRTSAAPQRPPASHRPGSGALAMSNGSLMVTG